MKITKLILAAYLLMSMAACDTDKNIAVYGEDSSVLFHCQLVSGNCQSPTGAGT